MQSQAINPPAQTRLEALKARHTQLSMRIEREQKRPGAMDGLLKSLKKQKLAIKEEMEGIRVSDKASVA